MKKRRCPSKRRRARHSALFESLEERRLLTFAPGDANEDFYFDEADLIQVAKFGKYRTGEPASWEEGDWDLDGEFTQYDLVSAFESEAMRHGRYRFAPYDDRAADPAVNQLRPLSDIGAADVTIIYFPESGDVITTAPLGMTALHLVSQSGSFSGVTATFPFDVATANSQFTWAFDGPHSWVEHHSLLPQGWSEQQVIEDLLVDGAMIGGGGLGTVRLGSRVELPAERPEDALITGEDVHPMFVEREDANGLLTYDPQTGDIRIESFGVTMEAVELKSPEALFTGTIGAEGLFTEHGFDLAKPERFYRVAWDLDGPFNWFYTPFFSRIYLPGIAQTGLSAEEFAAGVHPSGVTVPRDFLKLALEVGPIYSGCETHLSNGTLVGDANGDGRFDSTDLVSIFQTGEYEDEIAHNSTWTEGDWTCDGEFDTSDLVAAFQAGNYESPAAAIALRQSNKGQFSDKELAPPITGALQVQADMKRKEIELTTAFEVRRLSPEASRPLVTDEVMTDLESWFPPNEDWKHESSLTERESTLAGI